MAKSYEDRLFQLRALQQWRAAVSHYNYTLDEPVERLVRAVLSLGAEYLSSADPELEDEISEEAHELARAALKQTDFAAAVRMFRDDLLDAVMANLPADEHSTNSVLRLSNLLNDALSEAYVESLRLTIRHQRMDSLSNELRVAKGIQERLVPHEVPQVEGFDFAGRLIPATEVGGDYWSVRYHQDEDLVTVKLADVSGHGIAAATLVAAVKFISGGYFQSAKTPSWVMEQTNSVLVRETPTEILVSMVYGWIYPKTKEISIVNAGHEAAFICSSDGCMDIPPTGPVMGLGEARYGESRFQLRPNDILFFCSDGIAEAGRGTPFGLPRLKRLLSENRRLPANDLADRVIERVMDFAGQPHDDMSLVVVKVTEDATAEEE